MSEYKKEISQDDYLRALALFTVANEHYHQSARFADALNKIIMVVPENFPGGHVDDAIYSGDLSSVANFDEALRREGIKIRKGKR